VQGVLHYLSSPKGLYFCGLIEHMPASFYQIRQCENPACGLRYPLTEGHPFGERCPLCLGATRLELQKPLNQEPFLPSDSLPSPFQREGPGVRVEALLDNVRSAWNVGAIFRTADAFGVRRLHLCGITPTPENAAVAKTALGADKTIPWAASKNALATAQELKAAGAQLWALEQDERAVSIYDLTIDDLRFSDLPIVLIVGNEVTGVDPALLELCDKIFYIPMRGQKRSLNVEVAFGVAAQILLSNM
jgi:tRNA(Leu) C34 or U34 (ribose-2'-O)-methylase TrmL